MLDHLGYYPASLCLIAVVLGIVSLLVRNRRVNIAIGHGLAGVACAGIGVGAWRLYRIEVAAWELYSRAYINPADIPDQSTWCLDYAKSLIAVGTVLTATGIGFCLLGIAWLVSGRQGDQRQEAEQVMPPNGP